MFRVLKCEVATMEIVRFQTFGIMILVISNVMTKIDAATVSDTVVNSELDGKALVEMGNSLNKPLLTLLGKTFIKMKYRIDKEITENVTGVETNLQDNINDLTAETASERKTLKDELCKLKTCTEWTTWSQCSARMFGTFGASSRSRKCGGSSSLCPSHVVEKEETDSRICQGSKCKSDKYTITKHGFCIRVSTTGQTWASAQEECFKDGGHLINIDSEIKARDVNEALENLSVTNNRWIDGKRTLPNGEWIYGYGPEDSGYSNWIGGEPGVTDDCRAYVLSTTKWYWYGRKCTSTYYFICEML